MKMEDLYRDIRKVILLGGRLEDGGLRDEILV